MCDNLSRCFSVITALIIAIATCVLLVLSVLLVPKIKVFGVTVSTYWPVCLIGAVLMLCTGAISLSATLDGLTTASSINPIQILVLFVSMTFMSVFLDEMGFFRHVAVLATQRAKTNQRTVFLLLYALVAVLTIFTSNDVVILTFTPFICYFAKQTKINPIPYLVAEFCASNTWSMMLIIGNPTNVYLATGFGIDFMSYLAVMALPTVLAGGVQIGILLLLFNRKLSVPMSSEPFESKITDKACTVLAVVHLAVCLVLLVMSSYVGIDMWLICLICALSLIVTTTIVCVKQSRRPMALVRTTSRLPWALIPFVLSMFVIVLALKTQGITEILANLLGESNVTLTYGISSFLACNVMNNIPMSVLFSTIPTPTSVVATKAIYATVIGSNVGAFLTPIGALAGIMFTSLIGMRKIKFTFLDFVKYGVIIAIPTLLTALWGLELIL